MRNVCRPAPRYLTSSGRARRRSTRRSWATTCRALPSHKTYLQNISRKFLLIIYHDACNFLSSSILNIIILYIGYYSIWYMYIIIHFLRNTERSRDFFLPICTYFTTSFKKGLTSFNCSFFCT